MVFITLYITINAVEVWGISAANGLVENFNGAQQIANVTTRPRNRPNPIRAIFRDNPF